MNQEHGEGMRVNAGSFDPCPLCGGKDAVAQPRLAVLLKLEQTARTILRCEQCGFRFLSPFLTPEEVDALYNEGDSYFEDYLTVQYDEVVGAKLPYYRELEGRLSRLAGGRGRMLDLGCATGNFLAVFKKEGWDVHGAEVSDYCISYAHDHFGIPVLKGTVETVDFPPDFFDLVSLNHVLEHVRDPLSVLKRIHRWIKPGGLFLVEVPNEFNDLVFRLSNERGRRRMYVSKGPILHHQLFFTPMNLRDALVRTGWSLVETVTSSWHAPVPCHLFHSPALNKVAQRARKLVVMAGAIVERGEFIRCVARKS
jgi:2-polyprenyl-3-methyl-5-hydroxy-6-metoxy-1,4-benzoquinol methylase